MRIAKKIKKALLSPIWLKRIYFDRLISRITTVVYYRIIFGELGKSSVIERPLLISHPEKIRIGSKVYIRQGLRIEAITTWRDRQYDPNLIIGDGVSIEQDANITCASHVTIGKDTVVSFNVTITDVDHDYDALDIPVMRQGLKVKHTLIGENCFIGAGAKIFAGTKLGRQCIVGANAVVRGDFPDQSVIAGVPGRLVKRYNSVTRTWEKV